MSNGAIELFVGLYFLGASLPQLPNRTGVFYFIFSMVLLVMAFLNGVRAV